MDSRLTYGRAALRQHLAMSSGSSTTQPAHPDIVDPRRLAAGLAAFRVFFGLVWLSNGLTKLFFNKHSSFDWGFISFNLISRSTAQSILKDASAHSFQPLRGIYQNFVLANWGFFQWFLTAAEITAGLLLLFGIASRLGALIGVALIGPIAVMLIHTNQYLWTYPLDIFPLLVLAVVPAGRAFGVDRSLAQRFHYRWPF